MSDCTLAMRSVSFLSGFSDEELRRIQKCLKGKAQTYTKGEKIFAAGEPAMAMGVVLAGRVHVEDMDAFGNRSILAELHQGDVLAASYVCAQMPRYLTTYIATEPSEVLLLNCGNIFANCTKNCDIRSKVLENILKVIATEVVVQDRKIKCLSQRTTREKLIAFFSYCVREKQKNRFNIGFSRQELADYLCLNRSAMSKELCKMRDEGLLRFDKNYFEIL